MARLTLEDCLHNIDNRYDLVLLAAKRARQLSSWGGKPLVEETDDKPTVVALREIAEGLITKENIETINQPVQDMQTTSLLTEEGILPTPEPPPEVEPREDAQLDDEPRVETEEEPREEGPRMDENVDLPAPPGE